MSMKAVEWAVGQQTAKGTAKAVLVALGYRADRQTWKAWPGISLLALDVGVDERSVRRGLNYLVEVRLIVRHRRSQNGTRLVDEFELNPDRNQPDNVPDNRPGNLSCNQAGKLPAAVAKPTGQADRPNRTSVQSQPDNLPRAYRRNLVFEPRVRTQGVIIGEDLLGDPVSGNSKKAAAKKTPREMPESWPTDEDRDWAFHYWASNGHPELIDQIEQIAPNARDYHLAKGTCSKDWTATWRTWARNAIGFSRSSGGRRHRQTASDVVENLIAGRYRSEQ